MLNICSGKNWKHIEFLERVSEKPRERAREFSKCIKVLSKGVRETDCEGSVLRGFPL